MAKSINTPLLSVVLPVYNCEDYVAEAIHSILEQTYTDFELIVINDGSTDKTHGIIRKFNDPRIKIISRANKGLVRSLNEGVSVARGKYIARHDADDVSEPTRFEKQIALLNDNPSLVLLGTSIKTINSHSAILNTHTVLSGSRSTKAELFLRSPFAHGSVIFKKDAFLDAGQYTESEWPAEDYGLWIRMAKYGEFDNLQEPLYRYRENERGISALNNTDQKERTTQARERALKDANKLLSWFGKFENQRLPETNIRLAENVYQILMIVKKEKKILTFVKLTSMIIFSPTLLRKITGKIRRSI